MARLEVNGFDAVLGGLADLADRVPELRNAILDAEADVIEPAVLQALSANRLNRSGKLALSIGRKKGKAGGIPVIRIGPMGEHHRYMPSRGKNGIVTAGYVGYVYEYGLARRKIRPRKWLSGAVASATGAAYRAADAVYDNYLKEHNL